MPLVTAASSQPENTAPRAGDLPPRPPHPSTRAGHPPTQPAGRLYCRYKCLTEGRPQEYLRELREKLSPTMIANWKLWPAAVSGGAMGGGR